MDNELYKKLAAILENRKPCTKEEKKVPLKDSITKRLVMLCDSKEKTALSTSALKLMDQPTAVATAARTNKNLSIN